VLSELRNKFKEYLMESTVNFNTKLKEAASFGQPITEYDPGSRGYKDFVNLARELMGHQPLEAEPTPMDKLSRPAELVQRARQLAQLTNLQFGRNTMTSEQESPMSAPESVGAALARGQIQVGGRLNEPMRAQTATALASPEEELADAEARQLHLPEVSKGNNNGNGHAVIPSKSTAQKIEEFYGVKQVGGEVIFAARFEEAKKVLIAGDFNNWSPMSTPMINRGRPGEFYMCLPLRPGRYRYRFVVDGKWMTDPNNKYVEANQFGELNNVVEVE
jgi:chromosome partitioning protein